MKTHDKYLPKKIRPGLFPVTLLMKTLEQFCKMWKKKIKKSKSAVQFMRFMRLE